jgi:diaminopimelate epimerase
MVPAARLPRTLHLDRAAGGRISRTVKLPFRKMHGLGNDFVVLDARGFDLRLTPARAAALADRHTGVGCDQVIVLEPVEAGQGAADVFMRIRNPDGSEAGACGNATRCVAHLLAAETGRLRVTVRTVSGDLAAEALPDGRWRVDMGPARLGWRDIPLARETDTLHLPLSRGPVGDPAACSLGNPHATFFVPDLSRIRLDTFGPSLERDPLFPEGANIGFAQALAPDHLRLLMWERAAGPTRACGSGACAALVNAHRRGLADRRATVTLPGGDLLIEWREEDGHVLMTGPVATAFTGELDLDALAAAAA